MTTEITAKVKIDTIQFRSAEGWAVFTATNPETGNTLTCTGTLPTMVDVDSLVTVTGHKVMKDGYGEQFACDVIVPDKPDMSSDAGIVKILCRLKGIGESKAGAFVRSAREKGKDPLAWAMDDIRAVGVKEEFAQEETDKLSLMSEAFDSLVYMLGIGLTDKQANKIYLHFRSRNKVPEDELNENPYQIMGIIHGMGFLTVDKIAFKAGISAGNSARTQACIRYCLQDSTVNGGNTFMRGWELTKVVTSQLMDSATAALAGELDTIPDENGVRSQVYLLEQGGGVFIEDGKVYDSHLRGCEEIILESLG